MRNFLVHLSFLTALSLSIATSARSEAVKHNPVSLPQEVCSLPAPNNFHCTGTTPTSASFAWDNVFGASSYTVKIYISSTSTLVNTTIVPGEASTVEIPNLEPGVAYVTKITSTCFSGEQSESYSTASFITFILEIVVSGYIPASGPISCSLDFPQGNACSFPWDGSIATFRVSKPGSGVNFTVNRVYGTETVVMTADISGNTGFSFQGIMIPPLQYCGINASCSNLSKIRVFANEGSTSSAITDLYFATINGSGKIWTSGIKSGYKIQKFQESPSLIKEPDDIENLTARKQEYLPGFSEKVDIIAVNPFSDQIQITLDSDAKDPVSLQLLDFQGRALHHNEYPAGSEQYTMQAMDVPPGLYLLRVKIGTQITHLKLVKGQ